MRPGSTPFRRLSILFALVLAPTFALRSASVVESASQSVAATALALNWQVAGFPAVNLFGGIESMIVVGGILPSADPLGIVGFKVPATAPVSAVAAESDEIPTRMFLDQNFPNPFRPSTMIRYGLPGGSRVRLTVHTLIGSRIRVLVDQWQDAGVYTFDLVANDLPPGAYFYRLQTDYGTVTRRMIVARD